jgi:hypothetical protein
MTRNPASYARIRAGIEVAGNTLRYAEVEVPPVTEGHTRPRLLRMGACDFDIDVAEAILDPSGTASIDTVTRALSDIFQDSSAEHLSLAVHGWLGTSFFAPLPADASASAKFEQLQQEAALLADADTARPLQVTATPVRVEVRQDGREYHWHHVLRLAEAVQARTAYLARCVGPTVSHRFVDSAAAVAEVASRLLRGTEGDGGPSADTAYGLAVGVYGDRIELSVLRGGSWFFGHWIPAAEVADTKYFGAALLQRLGIAPTTVTRLFVYGHPEDHAAAAGIEALVNRKARPLDPLGVFAAARSQADPLVLSAFAPCVGAALR